MTEEKKPEQKRERRRHATEAAGKIGPMVKEYFGRTLRAEEEGNPLAYTFINCCYDEIIRAMDIIPVWSENFAGICGAKRVAQKFLERAEAQNFSRSMCTYALCGLGHDLSSNICPMSPFIMCVFRGHFMKKTSIFMRSRITTLSI